MSIDTSKSTKHIIRWSLFFVLSMWLIYLLGSMFTPFVIAAAIAYLLDPIVDKIENMGVSRSIAVGLMTLFLILILAIATVIVVPIMIQQLSELFQVLPEYFSSFVDFIKSQFPSLFSNDGMINQAISAAQSNFKSIGSSVADSLLSSTVVIADFFTLVFFVPIIVIYLLVDWDRMIAKVDDLLPRKHAPTIRNIISDIDQTLSSFARGQVSVCLILGVFYSVGLFLIGLNFALIVGSIAGAISFIPFVGALIGGGLAISIGLYQFWGEWLMVGGVAGIFFLGQFLEGNVITPKLVGKSIGLHPVWLLFALSAFGKLFGLTGLLIAVPVAACLGVLSRFMLDIYLDSSLYHGKADDQDNPSAHQRHVEDDADNHSDHDEQTSPSSP